MTDPAELELRRAYDQGRADALREIAEAPTPETDQAKTLIATRVGCGCPIYKEDLPLDVGWTCEHGNYWSRLAD